jgi:cobalt-zinc-cadmium resistance protein CzcA
VRNRKQRWHCEDIWTRIARENSRRRLTVRCDIVDRDQGGFVEEAQSLFEKGISLPNGYRVSWLGMFENLARARRHFQMLVPVAIVVIYLLLLATFGSQKAALLLLLAIPFAFIGGAIALLLRGMNLNVSTGVGFAAVFGVSIMNGVLIVRTITPCDRRGSSWKKRLLRGRCAVCGLS